MARVKKRRKASLRELNGVEIMSFEDADFSGLDGSRRSRTKKERSVAGKLLVCQKVRGKKKSVKCFIFPRKNYIVSVGKIPRSFVSKKKSVKRR